MAVPPITGPLPNQQVNTPPQRWPSAVDPNIPSWEVQQLNALSGSNNLYGVNPMILAGIDQAESSGFGGSINPQGYGGWFGLGQTSSYPGGQSTPGLLQGTGQAAFDTQAELSASDFASLLKQYGGNTYLAEHAYQYGGNAPATPTGEGVNVFQQLGIGPTTTGYNPQAGAIAGALGGQLTPAELAQQQQGQLISQQLALSPAEYQAQLAILQANYGYSQQQFGIQGQQLALQGTGLQQQLANLGTTYGFQQQGDVISGQNIQGAIQNLLAGYGLEQQQLALSHTQANQGQAASGVYNTGTHTQAEQQFGIQAAQEKQAFQYGMFQEQQAQKSLGLTEAEQKQQFGYSTQQIQNGQKALDLQMQSLGISKAQAQTQYQNAVQQLGLSNLMNVNQLEQQIAIMAGGGYSPLSGMMGQLMQVLPQLSGLFSQIQTGGTGTSGSGG